MNWLEGIVEMLLTSWDSLDQWINPDWDLDE
jgi:hypothetical protein